MITSPFQHTTLHEAAREVLASAKRNSQYKRNSRGLGDRCAAANIGYEPVVFESLGDLEKGGEDLLKSIQEEVSELSFGLCHRFSVYDWSVERECKHPTSCSLSTCRS